MALSRAAVNGVEARNQYNAALPLFRAMQDQPGEAWTVERLADIHSATGEIEDARNHRMQALSLFTAIQQADSVLRVQRKFTP